MRVPNVILDKDSLWSLLKRIKEKNEHVFIVCLLTAYMGARFTELQPIVIRDLYNKRFTIGKDFYNGTGRDPLVHPHIKQYLVNYADRQTEKSKTLVSQLNIVQVNKIVVQSAKELNMQNTTFVSLRKTFGHNIYKQIHNYKRSFFLDITGFKRNSKVNPHMIFELPNKK